MPFSIAERQAALNTLGSRPVDLLIIGGGAVGCSAAAHAARLGLSVVLVERDDFASGASGNSTGLAHAGLRYLAQGRVLYVFHESRERRRLQRLAPHLVKPFDFLYPVYDGDPFSLRMVRLGTWIYDRMAWLDARLAHAPSPKPFETLTADALCRRVPGLKKEGLTGATAYFVDAQLPDQRFTVALAQAAYAYGARILTHMAVETIKPVVHLHDQLTQKVYTLEPRHILNCAGAWIDEVRKLAGLSGSILTRSRGMHLVVDRLAELPLIFSAKEKGRVFFVLPAPGNTSIVGTTDVEEKGNPDASVPTAQEGRDLLQTLRNFFPDKTPKLRSVYWGVRPLYKQPGHVSDASREHRLIKETDTFWSLPGVKLTAARAAGEEAACAIYQKLRGKKIKAVDLGLLPGKDREPRLQSWLHLYHAENTPIVPEETWRAGEAGYSAGNEMALTLNDFLWRRSKWPLYREIPAEALERIIQSMARVLGWDALEQKRQRLHYERQLNFHKPGTYSLS